MTKVVTKEQWRKRKEQWEKFNEWERTQPRRRVLTMKEILRFVKKVRKANKV